MKSTLRKCLAAAFVFAASLAPSVFAQDVNWAEVPFIDIKKVTHSTVQVQGYTGNWACTTLELQAKPCNWAPNFKSNDWINNLKVTLTMAYPKTNTALSGAKARGTQEEKDAAMEASEEAAGTDTTAKYIYYRASVNLVGLQVGAGRASSVSFFIPAEIVERESKLSGAMLGQAKPEFYLVEFSYRGNPLPVCNPKGELLSRKALDFPAGRRPSNMKTPAEFVQWMQDNAGSSVSDTQGLLLPYVYLPFPAWPRNAPAVIFENVAQ